MIFSPQRSYEIENNGILSDRLALRIKSNKSSKELLSGTVINGKTAVQTEARL